MRFSLAVLAVAAVASASASTLVSRQLPTCAGDCLANADFGSCSPTDNACLCKNQQFISSTTQCIEQKCQGSDLQAAITAAQQLCAAVGVTLTSSAAAQTSSASESGTSAAASGSGSSSTRPASTTRSGSSAASTATSPASSGSSSTGAPAPSGSNAAIANGVNALAGIAALGLAAIAL